MKALVYNRPRDVRVMDVPDEPTVPDEPGENPDLSRPNPSRPEPGEDEPKKNDPTPIEEPPVIFNKYV